MIKDVIEGRFVSRTNMFIAAVMMVEGSSSPIKVRNMSRHGALIDTPVTLCAGDRMVVSRGSLAACGTVVWSAGGRCGVHFTSAIAVGNWMAAPRNPGQATVDDLMLRVRADMCEKNSRSSNFSLRTWGSDTAARLSKAQGLLKELAEALSDDAGVVEKYGLQLQNLDLVLRLIKRD